MIKFAVENIEDIIEELKPLTEAHWEEIALNKDNIKLNPDWERYKMLSKCGMLQLVTARIEGKLIGYCCDIIATSLHYSDHLFAVNDVLFLHHDHRKGKNAIALLKFVENELKKRNASVHYLHMKIEHDFESLAQYLGYKKVEYNYSKFLGGL